MATDEPEGAATETRTRESGLSLVELMMATVLTVIGLVAIMQSCIRLHSLQRLDAELDCAHRACRTNLETLRTQPIASLIALDGTGFDVPGADGITPLLQAGLDDADGLPGAIRVRLERVSGGRSQYRIEAAVQWLGAMGPQSVAFATLWGGVP